MTFDTFAGLVMEHWVLMSLVLCPIIIVLMALGALSCEACGAPFGIFRRRNRTIDLCLRCAVLHDIRRAKETRDASSSDEGGGSKPGSGSSSGSSSVVSDASNTEPGDKGRSGGAVEDRRSRGQSSVPLSVAVQGSRHGAG